MPILPLDYPEPFAATLGVMLYPGLDELEQRKARAFTAQLLAESIRRSVESGLPVSERTLAAVIADMPRALGEETLLSDSGDRWWAGTATGEILKTFFIMARTHERLASWSAATKVAERAAGRALGSRTQFYQARGHQQSVAHLWGAWAIRGGQFVSRPEIGYDGWTDFQFFLAEAEILRDWGQNWRTPRERAQPPLPADAWRVPDDWRPPERQPGWPNTGKVPLMSLPDELLAALKPAGRPRSGDR